MDRRQFLLSGLALLAPRTSVAASATIDILPDEPIGTISPISTATSPSISEVASTTGFGSEKTRKFQTLAAFEEPS